MCNSDPAKLLRAEAERERSSTGGCSNRASSSSNELQPVRRARQRDIRDMADDLARGRLDYLWATVVAENDLAFNASKSKALQAFVDAALIFAKPYTLPTPYKVSGPLLEKLKADTEDLDRPIKDSWSTRGCSQSVDGWTCLKSCGMVCVIVQYDTAPVIVDIVDSKTAKKTGEYLAALIRKLICTLGDRKVVQVVMDNASNNKQAADMLREGFPQVFFTNCATHVLELMLRDMGNIRVVKRVLSQVHRVVMMVKGSASAVVLFREVFSTVSLVKRALRAMVISEEWEEVAVARTEEGRAVRTLLLDDFFWDLVTAVHRLMTPVYGVLRVVDKRSLIMGVIYGRMIDATIQTNEAAGALPLHPRWMYGGEVAALQELAVMSLSQPVTSSEVEMYWSALASVQRRDRNRLAATKMTDVTYVAFTRRARDAFDRRQGVREKLYLDLSNGTLKEGSTIAPVSAEEEEGGAGLVEEEEEGSTTINWDEFGSIGKKKRKFKVGESSKRKRKGKGKGNVPCKGKGKGAVVEEEEEEEAADSKIVK
ncbi:unnamed protein product [Closterium sp. NIES-53]